MKRILLIFILTTSAGALYAQFEDTKLLLGGTLNYNNSVLHDNNPSIGVAPSLAKPINSNSLIGISGNFTTSMAKIDTSNLKTSNAMTGLGAFYQRFYPIATKVYFSWQGLVSFDFNHLRVSTNLANDDKVNTQGYGLRLVPGLSWKPMERLMFNASFGGASYYYSKTVSGSSANKSGSNKSQLTILFNRPQFGVIFFIKQDAKD